jgi:hypothetical protein
VDRSTGRATAISIALHAVVLAGALLIRWHLPDGPTSGAVINGELVSELGSLSSSTSVPAADDTAGAPPAAPPLPRDDSPPSSREPAANAALAEVASAPASEPAANDTPTPDLSASAAPADSAEQRQDAAEAVADSALAAAATAASDDTITERTAPEPTEPDVSAVAPAVPSAGELAAATPAVAEPVDTRPALPATTREQDMLGRRFASWTGPLATGATESRVAWKQNGQAYTAVFHQQPSGDPMGVEHVVIDVSTTQGGKKLSTQMTMTRLSFSNFAQFVDRWDPEVQIHDDEIDGRFHSNTEIHLLSTGSVSPVFHGKVTLAAHDIDTGDSMFGLNRRRVFPEGVEMGVHRIALPSHFLGFLNDAAKGDANVQRFERDARITFYEDGTYGWSYLRDGAPEERRAVTAPAHYLLGLSGATLRIKGRVRGKVLVYTPERIVIDNDLRYARERDAPDADDYVGLVAEKTVEIAEPDVTGLGDLHVDGSIYALRQFAVRDFRSRASGTLTIFGSLTAGSLTATEPRYATKIEFDPRLKNARPPSFPLTDRYELDSWDGEWRVDDGGAPAQDEARSVELGPDAPAATDIDREPVAPAATEVSSELSASSSR